MLNFGASKPRVKGGGARAPGAPPGSAPGTFISMDTKIGSPTIYTSGFIIYSLKLQHSHLFFRLLPVMINTASSD